MNFLNIQTMSELFWIACCTYLYAMAMSTICWDICWDTYADWQIYEPASLWIGFDVQVFSFDSWNCLSDTTWSSTPSETWRGIDWAKMNSILVGFIINCSKRTLRLGRPRTSWVNCRLRLIQPSKDPPGGLRWLQETKGSSQMKLEAQLGGRISVADLRTYRLWVLQIYHHVIARFNDGWSPWFLELGRVYHDPPSTSAEFNQFRPGEVDALDSSIHQAMLTWRMDEQWWTWAVPLTSCTLDHPWDYLRFHRSAQAMGEEASLTKQLEAFAFWRLKLCVQNEYMYPIYPHLHMTYELGEVCRFTMASRMCMHERSCSQEVVRKKDEQTLLTQDGARAVGRKTYCLGGKMMYFAAGRVFAVRTPFKF